ncbi:hypothetical protein [Pseudolysinimonas sp.]|uniref:hypothetical protein n=1 Tax=Pseudolysinimonas sp. TaxID=2680009 RepID=UPI00286AEF3A|nr:hypothetical protein [Pseudolysinimonas sp.]
MSLRAVPSFLTSLAVGALALVTMTACSGPPPPTVVDTYISEVSFADSDATVTLVSRQIETGSGDGPELTVGASATVINGGSLRQTIRSDTAFKAVRVAVEALVEPTEEPTGLGVVGASASAHFATAADSDGTPDFGYWEIVLAEPATEADLVFSVPQALPGQEFVTYFAAVDESGRQGTPVPQAVEALPVGTGDVQVSVSWDVDSDLDLHVVEPNGEEIFWDALTSASGGDLDLDSNAGCMIDSVRNENVTWEEGTAPAGEYTVRIDLWSSCEVTPTRYVVTVVVLGQVTRTITGSVDGPGDEGHVGSGEVVATFVVDG